MSRSSVSAALAAVSLIALSPAAASAQSTATADNSTVVLDNATNMDSGTDPALNTATADPYATTPPVGPTEEDDNDFPWGLLGLLGLAGLLGLKRRDDVYVDRTPGTGNGRV